MPDVDLDAARRARAETAKARPSIKLGGKKFRLVSELPIAFADLYAEAMREGTGREEAEALVRSVLADPAEVDAVFAAGLTWGDIPALLAAWKADAGESSASASSSTNGGTRSRPTSKRTTASTSRKPSTTKG